MLNPRNRLSVWLLRLCVVLLIALAIVTAQWMGAEKQKQIAEKQRHIAEVKIEADLATEWFETHPTQALLMAMRSVYKLKNLEKTEKLGEYPTAEPIMALQTILNQIQARQYYDGRLLYTSEDGEIEFPDGPDTYISSNNNGRVVFTDKGDRFIYSGNLSRSRGSRLRFSPLFPFFRLSSNRKKGKLFCRLRFTRQSNLRDY